MRRLWPLWIFALLAVASPARSETAQKQLRILQEQALADYKAGKFADCAKGFSAALAIRPHHPRLLYNFAACSARAGGTNDAVRALGEYADMGLIAEVEKDDDFASLETVPAFTAVLDKMRTNGKPIGESKIIVRLTEPFLAEGIAYDPTSKRFFISSVDQRKIVQIASDGTIADFVTSGEYELLGAFGMAIDAKRQLLHVASSGVPHAHGLTEIERRTVGVRSFSLRTHGATAGILIVAKDQKTTGVVGDVFVGPDDNREYATDSVLPVIYTGPASVWLESDAFVSLQGMTTTPDDKAFVVADYARGLHFIDRATKTVQTIDYAGGTTLLGIDGLYRAGDRLIAVQNGVAPIRILAMTFDASGRGIASVKVISANDPNIPEPSLGTIKDDEFCVVANAQWSRFNDDGTRKQPLDPPRIACIGQKSAQP